LIGALDTNYELIIESSKELKKDDRQVTTLMTPFEIENSKKGMPNFGKYWLNMRKSG
jgi:hypothetical protein